MPWLTVHVALPLAILAGYVLGRLAEGARAPAIARRVPVTLAFAGVALLALLAIRSAAAVAYTHPDTPIEPLIYTQTSPDIPALTRQIEAYAAAHGGRDQLPIVVDSSESMAWPWAWYLREFPKATFVGAVLEETIPEGAVLLLWRDTEASSARLGEGYATREPYTHRWWFPEEGYRAATLKGLVDGLFDGSLLPRVGSFYVRGEERFRLGKLNGVALFPEVPPALTMPTTGETYGN